MNNVEVGKSIASSSNGSESSRTQLKLRKMFSLSLLGIAVAGIGITTFFESQLSPGMFQILVHGFEGALVGGLCDWFAVKKTYQAIQDNHTSVAEGIGKYIREEILNANVVKERLSGMLDSPEAMNTLRQSLSKAVPDEPFVTQWILDKWKSNRESIFDFIAKLDLTVSRHQLLSKILSEKAVIDNAKFCVSMALKQSVGTKSFKDLEQTVVGKLGVFGGMFFPGFEKLIPMLESGISDPVMGERLMAAFATFKDEYLKSWNSLSLPQRRDAVQSLLDPLMEDIAATLAGFVMAEREKLERLSTIRSHNPLRILITWAINALSDTHMEHVSGAVVGALKRIDRKQFAQNFERHTRLYLEVIRINGTLLGFVLGAVLAYAMAAIARAFA